MKKFGLLGKNINYTYSPILHNKIFEIYNIEGDYEIFNLENESQIYNFLKILKKEKTIGINVTIPYKTSILKYVDIISPEVLSIGAANCIKFENEKIIAYNTDYFGVLKTFEKMGLDLKNKKVIVLGSGGAAKATIKALLDSKAIVYLVSRNKIKAQKEFENIFFLSYEELVNSSGYLIINATPVGTFPDTDISPVSSEILQNFDFALDLIYNPEETQFLKYAKSKGKKVENGLYMLIAQGVKSEEIWNNLEFNYEKIYNDLIDIIYKK